MNGIIGMTELLRITELNLEQERLVDTLNISANRLMGLLSNILDFSKIEANSIELFEEVFNFWELIHNEIAFARTSRLSKNGVVHLELAPETNLSLKTDPLRLGQILNNLLSNAVKFCVESYDIKVSTKVLQTDGDLVQIHLTIADLGIGIGEDDLEKIFDVFTQADDSSTRKFEGPGLGLALCKRFLTLLNGQIWVESTLGEGSTFHISFWAQKVDSLNPATEPLPPRQIAVSSLGDLPELRILVVEDDLVNRSVLKGHLATMGYTAKFAIDGGIGLEMLMAEPFDLVLMDIQLPKLNGIQVLSGYKKQHPDSETYFIALTAYAMKGDRERFIAAGMDDYLAKPYFLSDMIPVVKKGISHISKEKSQGLDQVN